MSRDNEEIRGPYMAKPIAGYLKAWENHLFQCGYRHLSDVMQAVVMVNDHITDCFRYQEIKNPGKPNKAIGRHR